MQQKISGMSCQLGSWALAAGVGLLTTVLLLIMSDTSILGSLFLGGVAFAILGLLFSWLFCRELPEARGPGNITASDTAAKQKSAPVTSPAPAAETPKAPAPKAEPAPTATEPTTPASASPTVTASKSLPGQDDLASRKGDWKYDKGDAGKAASKPAPAAAAAAPKEAPAAAAKDAPVATPDYDGDGVQEGSGEGKKPEALSQAREGGPDNLKEIKGVGPKLEQLLNSMGFFHFDQIANWTADEIAWVNANLEGFKGRVTRDNWVEQAKILAAGGDTEFSKRVDKGGVY